MLWLWLFVVLAMPLLLLLLLPRMIKKPLVAGRAPKKLRIKILLLLLLPLQPRNALVPQWPMVVLVLTVLQRALRGWAEQSFPV